VLNRMTMTKLKYSCRITTPAQDCGRLVKKTHILEILSAKMVQLLSEFSLNFFSVLFMTQKVFVAA